MSALDEVVFWNAASRAFSNDALELILLPTEQCNLRCSYCYEHFQLGRMSAEVVGAIKNLIERRAPELRTLRVEWFGGEPLLAMSIIEEIGSFAVSMKDRNPHLAYASSVTTNGVLLTFEVARRLAQVETKSIHVSLDGPGIVHDQTRSSRSGKGTFSRIVANLRAIRDNPIDLQVNLRVHVTPGNFELLDSFTDELIEMFLGDSRFSVYFFPIVDLGGPNRGHISILSPSKAAELVQRLTERVRDARADMASVPNGIGCASPYVCYAAKANAWVIRSDGRLSKCTVGLDDRRNDVGRIMADGTLDVHGDKARLWMRGWVDGDEMSLHCPYEGLREDVQQGTVIRRTR